MFLVTLMRVPCQKTEQVSFLGLARFYEIASVGYAATSSEPQNMGRPTLFRKARHLPGFVAKVQVLGISGKIVFFTVNAF